MIDQLIKCRIRKSYSIIAHILEVVNKRKVQKAFLCCPGGNCNATTSRFGQLWAQVNKKFAYYCVAICDDHAHRLVIGEADERPPKICFANDTLNSISPVLAGSV